MENEYVCPKCDAEFNTVGDYLEHVETHLMKPLDIYKRIDDAVHKREEE